MYVYFLEGPIYLELTVNCRVQTGTAHSVIFYTNKVKITLSLPLRDAAVQF